MPDHDSLERTVATLTLFSVWAAIVVFPMFTVAEPPPWELRLGTTGIAFLVLGRMWGIDIRRLLDGLTISIDVVRSRGDDREECER